MTKDLILDIKKMQQQYSVDKWISVNKKDPAMLEAYLNFRINFLEEELQETRSALQNYHHADIVDGLIDICVVALGTLDAFGVNTYKAWNDVLRANMAKQVGVKLTRPNPLGLPDLIKPADWIEPEHTDNVGHFNNLTGEKQNERVNKNT